MGKPTSHNERTWQLTLFRFWNLDVRHKKMADKGLLQRRRADKDERITILSLTSNGKALEEKAKDIPAKILASLSLEPDELVLLQKLSKKMLTNFREKH